MIEPELVKDERGMFARTWCQKEFEAQGLKVTWVQSSISVNSRKGTMRGMHYQVVPHEEVKLVRCTMGAIYDVIVDLRPASPTYCHHVGVMLSAENRRMLYIPEQFAHGFLTLEDKSEVSYHMSEILCAGKRTWVSMGRCELPSLNGLKRSRLSRRRIEPGRHFSKNAATLEHAYRRFS